MKNIIIIFCAAALLTCGSGISTEPKYPEPEIKYIYQNDNPIEITPPQLSNQLNGIFAWMLCRNKSDSVWTGHPEMKLEDANNRGSFEKACIGFLTTKYDLNTSSPADTIYSIKPGEQAEAWIYCPHDWDSVPSVIPWISFVTDN